MSSPEEKKTFSPSDAKLLATYEYPQILYASCLDPDRRALFVGGSDYAVYRVDLAAEKPAVEQRWRSHDNYVSALTYHDGVVISGSYDGQLIWTNAESGESLRGVKDAHAAWIRDAVLARDGSFVASVADDMLVKLWDAKTGELITTFAGHERLTPEGFATALYAVAISPDGTTVASADRIGHVCLWDVKSGKRLRRFEAPTFYTYDAVKRSRSIGGIRSLAFSPDGSKLAVAGIGAVSNVDGFVGPCRMELWNCVTGERIAACQDKHQAVLNHVAFHPVEPWIVAAGGGDGGGVISFWNRQGSSSTHLAKLKGHAQHFSLDAEGRHLYAAGHGGVQAWTLFPREG